MAWEPRPLVSLLGSALFAAALGAGYAFASGPGSDGDDEFADDIANVSDNSGSDGGGDNIDDDHDGSNSGHGGGDDDHSDSSGGDDDDTVDVSDSGGSGDSGSSGGDDENSGSNSGSDGDSGSSSGESGSGDSGSNSGSSSSEDSHSHSGTGSGDSGSHSGSSSGRGHDEGDAHASHFGFLVDHDDSGREFVHGEVLVTGAARDIEVAREAGFTLISTASLSSLDAQLARMQVPDGLSLEDAVLALGRLAPHALVTPNNVYRHSQSFISGAPMAPTHRTRRFVGMLGIIDTGVDAASLPAPNALLSQRSFAGPRSIARQHGAVVATLAVERGMRVHVADVFGQSADGELAASADSIAAALDWMIESDIPVINVSIEGPNNLILQQLVRRAAERGHVVVAAAGNGGPMARPAYPAAYEGAVAVTAIDEDGHPYLRANRGAYIAFAAPGVDVDVPSGESHITVSGTSFAAPIIAADIAAHMRAPSLAQAQRALAALRERAEDLGAPGRDPIYGWGALRD